MMISLERVFQPENVSFNLDVTNQRVWSSVLILPAPRKENRETCYGWSLTAEESMTGWFNPTLDKLRELGYGTEPFDDLGLAGNSKVRAWHLEACFRAGFARVRNVECMGQAAMAKLGSAIASLRSQVPDFELSIGPTCPIFSTRAMEHQSDDDDDRQVEPHTVKRVASAVVHRQKKQRKLARANSLWQTTRDSKNSKPPLIHLLSLKNLKIEIDAETQRILTCLLYVPITGYASAGFYQGKLPYGWSFLTDDDDAEPECTLPTFEVLEELGYDISDLCTVSGAGVEHLATCWPKEVAAIRKVVSDIEFSLASFRRDIAAIRALGSGIEIGGGPNSRILSYRMLTKRPGAHHGKALRRMLQQSADHRH